MAQFPKYRSDPFVYLKPDLKVLTVEDVVATATPDTEPGEMKAG
jgi:hypothetical protein